MAATRRIRLTITLVVTAALLVGVGFAVKSFVGSIIGSPGNPFVADTCTVGSYELDPGQASVAATMIGAVTSYKTTLPVRAQVLVLAAALQESKLRNIPSGEGDRDSVGVLQQRPSQGWGSAKSLADVGTATTRFLNALVKIDDWQRLPAAEAIQRVQISADGSLYAQHEAQATVLAAALSGRTPAGVTCEIAKPTQVAPVAVIAKQVGEELGIDTPVAAGPRTVRVPGAGWQTVAWFVCNADRLGIERVAYDEKQWTRTDGWRASTASEAVVTASVATV